MSADPAPTDGAGSGVLRLGVILPNSGPQADPERLAAAAQAAEQTGAASVWVSDHLLLIDAPVRDYPFSSDGRPTWSPEANWYEALSCCSFLSGITSRVRIGTATLTLPQRNVLQLAKETATIDRLSGGRLELGVGVGWSEAEMAALGYDYRRRGPRLEEMVRVLRDCWTGRPRPFDGRDVQVPDGLRLHPRPVQPLGPPLLIGGMSPAAVRRAATIGDGWLAIAFTDSWDEMELRTGVARLRALSSDRDRPARGVLKLHCRDGEYSRMEGLLARSIELGFDEVMIDLPWELGVTPAMEVLAPLLAIGTPS